MAPFGLRLTPELRASLQREANINGRSLNAEILARLRVSFEPGPLGQASHVRAVYSRLSDSERLMISVFKRLSPDKQLALISLFQ